MEKELKETLRRQYPVFGKLTESEVRQLENDVRHLPQTPDAIRVCNYAELLSLRVNALPGMRQIGMFPTRYDLRWEGGCELLFIEQHYGPCCIWARATTEMILQDWCLSEPSTSGEFEKRKRALKGKNPGLRDCMEILGSRLSSYDRKDCDTLADHGDWQVHHRIDRISGGLSYEDVLRELGVSEKDLKKPGFKKGEQLVMKGYRERKGREMALTSMRALYGFLSRRGNSPTP